MIFVTVGTQMPFDRLVRAVDDWAGVAGVEVEAQTANGSYRPSHVHATPWLKPDEFRARLERADAVIGHAGMGTILSALEFGKPLLVLPRRGHLGETRNDHQVATARRFGERCWVLVAQTEKHVAPLATQLLERAEGTRVPTAASESLVRRIRDFLDASRKGGG